MRALPKAERSVAEMADLVCISIWIIMAGPVSYEWVNSTPISKIWEQMTEAFEYGIHDLWIVNVGDEISGISFKLLYGV